MYNNIRLGDGRTPVIRNYVKCIPYYYKLDNIKPCIIYVGVGRCAYDCVIWYNVRIFAHIINGVLLSTRILNNDNVYEFISVIGLKKKKKSTYAKLHILIQKQM